MSAQLSECFGETSFPGPHDVAKADSDYSAVLEPCPTDEAGSSLESDESIEPQAVAVIENKAEDVEFIEVQREQVVRTLNNSDRDTYIFVVHVGDGKFFIGTAVSQKALNEQLKRGRWSDGVTQYQTDQDVDPIVLPNKNKLDLAKYACLLGTKYGWDNVAYCQDLFEEIRSCLRGIHKTKKSEKQQENTSCCKKKLIFKRKEKHFDFAFVSKIRGVVSVIRRLVTRRA